MRPKWTGKPCEGLWHKRGARFSRQPVIPNSSLALLLTQRLYRNSSPFLATFLLYFVHLLNYVFRSSMFSKWLGCTSLSSLYKKNYFLVFKKNKFISSISKRVFLFSYQSLKEYVCMHYEKNRKPVTSVYYRLDPKQSNFNCNYVSKSRLYDTSAFDLREYNICRLSLTKIN